MTLLEKLGLTPQMVALDISDYQKSVEIWVKVDPNRHDDPWLVLGQRSLALSQLALAYYLHGRNAEATEPARGALAAVQSYLFGHWRATTVPKATDYYQSEGLIWWRTHFPWIEQYRRGIFWACCLRDWQAITELSQYPDDDVVNESSLTSFKTTDRAWYILLAKHLRGLKMAELDFHCASIQMGHKRKPKCLLEIIRALWENNSTKLSATATRYMNYYEKNEFPQPGIESKVSVDGTIMVHLAAKNDLKVDLAPTQRDFIVRLE